LAFFGDAPAKWQPVRRSAASQSSLAERELADLIGHGALSFCRYRPISAILMFRPKLPPLKRVAALRSISAAEFLPISRL